MPDIKDLSDDDRKKLLGCISGKNAAYREEHKIEEVPADVAKKHFSECSKALGLEDYEMTYNDLMNFEKPLETAELKGIEIFAAGTWTDSGGNKKTYSEADLDEMVSNFNILKNKIKPYLKLMHLSEEDHKKITAAPSLGWITNLYRNGKKLIADFSHVPKKVYDLIKAGSYRRISAEIFRSIKDEADNNKVYRNVVSAAGLLGAVTPALTTLEDVFKLYGMDSNKAEIYPIVSSDDWLFTVGDQAALCFYTASHTEGGDKIMEDLEKLQAKIDEAKKSGKTEFESNLRTELGLDADADIIGSLKEIKANAEKQAKAIAEKEKAEFESELNKVFMAAKKEGKLLPAEEPSYRLMVESLIEKSTDGKVEFSWGEGKDKKTISGEPLECLKTLFEKRPKVARIGEENGEVNVNQEISSYKMPEDLAWNAGDLKIKSQNVAGDAWMQQIHAYQTEHKCDFMTAYCAVLERDKPAEPDVSAYSISGDTVER